MQHPDGGLASHYHSCPAAYGILSHKCLHEILPMENCWRGCEVYRRGRGEWCWDCNIYKLVKKTNASCVKSQLPPWMVCVNGAQLLVCLWLLKRLQIQWSASHWIWARNCAGIWRKKISKNC